jgi:hypothetical protein
MENDKKMEENAQYGLKDPGLFFSFFKIFGEKKSSPFGSL